MRVDRHPILGDSARPENLRIWVSGREIEAREGETIAAAMLAAGMRICRTTAKTGEPRGIFCGIGQCTDCVMQVDGVPNVRTCITRVREGMIVERQEGLGRWEDCNEDNRD